MLPCPKEGSPENPRREPRETPPGSTVTNTWDVKDKEKALKAFRGLPKTGRRLPGRTPAGAGTGEDAAPLPRGFPAALTSAPGPGKGLTKTRNCLYLQRSRLGVFKKLKKFIKRY